MAQFRKKPVIVEAVRWGQVGAPSNPAQVVDWIVKGGGRGRYELPRATDTNTRQNGEVVVHQRAEPVPEHIAIETLEGTMRALPGDFIIKGVQGEFYPCRADIFAATYEAV